jgi:hypothetical protein
MKLHTKTIIMKYFSKNITINIFIMFLGLYASNICAQQAIPASGGDATGTGGSASYTVGQVTYTTATGTNGTVHQGVQLPYEIFVVTGLEEANGIGLELSVYPNPTKDYLNLTINDNELKELSYQLYDNNGKLLDIKDITGLETQIEMSDYPSAAYYLHVIHSQKTIKTFKIIKN